PENSLGIIVWDGNEWSLSSTVEMPDQVADGEIEPNNERAVSGDTVEDFLNKYVGIDVAPSNGTQPLEPLLGVSREDIPNNPVWGQGHVSATTGEPVPTSEFYIHTRDYYPIKKGVYSTNLWIPD